MYLLQAFNVLRLSSRKKIQCSCWLYSSVTACYMIQCTTTANLWRDKRTLGSTQIWDFMCDSWTNCPWPTERTNDKKETKEETQAQQQRCQQLTYEAKYCSDTLLCTLQKYSWSKGVRGLVANTLWKVLHHYTHFKSAVILPLNCTLEKKETSDMK